jgi:transposase
MKLHTKARTCPNCRLLIVEWVLQDRRPVDGVARDFRISVRTVRKWIKRYREHGVAGLAGRSLPRPLDLTLW